MMASMSEKGNGTGKKWAAAGAAGAFVFAGFVGVWSKMNSDEALAKSRRAVRFSRESRDLSRDSKHIAQRTNADVRKLHREVKSVLPFVDQINDRFDHAIDEAEHRCRGGG